MPKKTVNLTEKDLERLERLKEHFDAMSTNEVIRRSIAQSSALSTLVDSDGLLNVDTDNGKVKVQLD